MKLFSQPCEILFSQAVGIRKKLIFVFSAQGIYLIFYTPVYRVYVSLFHRRKKNSETCWTTRNQEQGAFVVSIAEWNDGESLIIRQLQGL
jgi:hypothetical protein